MDTHANQTWLRTFQDRQASGIPTDIKIVAYGDYYARYVPAQEVSERDVVVTDEYQQESRLSLREKQALTFGAVYPVTSNNDCIIRSASFDEPAWIGKNIYAQTYVGGAMDRITYVHRRWLRTHHETLCVLDAATIDAISSITGQHYAELLNSPHQDKVVAALREMQDIQERHVDDLLRHDLHIATLIRQLRDDVLHA